MVVERHLCGTVATIVAIDATVNRRSPITPNVRLTAGHR
jgi:hypothetical protein